MEEQERERSALSPHGKRALACRWPGAAKERERQAAIGGEPNSSGCNRHVGSFGATTRFKQETTTNDKGAYNFLVTPHPMPYCGTLFELALNPDGTWTRCALYLFTSQNGAFPHGGLVFDKAGNLYGTAGWDSPEVEQVPKTQRQVKPPCLRRGYCRALPLPLFVFRLAAAGCHQPGE